MTRNAFAVGLAALLVTSAGAVVAPTSAAMADEQPPTRLLMPIMSPERGRQLFIDKGCITCHAINGIGGQDASSLDADDMEPFMGIYDLVARMWSMAPVMIPAQEDELGEQIQLTGDELADLVAFLHDDREQDRLTLESLSPEQREMLESIEEHGHGNDDHD